MCRPTLQQLISIDLFWRQFLVCGQEGLGARGLCSGFGLGAAAREVELPGRGGRALWAWTWPFGSAPGQLVHALPAQMEGRKPPCGDWGHGITVALSIALEPGSS